RPAVRAAGEHLSDVGQTAQRSWETAGGLDFLLSQAPTGLLPRSTRALSVRRKQNTNVASCFGSQLWISARGCPIRPDRFVCVPHAGRSCKVDTGLQCPPVCRRDPAGGYDDGALCSGSVIRN